MADKIGTDEYGEILIYQTDDGQTNIEVKIEDDTVWLTQQQMSELFQTSRTNVVEHIKHIYEEGELDEISTCRNFRQVRKEGNREVTRQITKPLILIDFKSRRFFAFSCTCLHSTLTKWLKLCERRTHLCQIAKRRCCRQRL